MGQTQLPWFLNPIPSRHVWLVVLNCGDGNVFKCKFVKTY